MIELFHNEKMCVRMNKVDSSTIVMKEAAPCGVKPGPNWVF